MIGTAGRRTGLFLALVVGALTLGLVLPNSARADPVTDGADAPVLIGSATQDSKPLTASERALSAKKSALAREYGARKSAGALPGELQAIVDHAFVLTRETVRPSGAHSSDVAQNSTRSAQLAAAYQWHYLYPSTPIQITGYYCGPASAVSLMGYVYGYGSAWDGTPLTQTGVAGSNWLKTNTGGTGWGWDTWGHTLNSWQDGTDWGWYTLQGSPDAYTYEWDLGFDIDTYHPMVLDVHMTYGGAHLVGYPYYVEYWHYAVASGYEAYGSQTVYDDPYNGYAGTYGRHYGFANSTMVSLLAERGIVW